MNFERVTIISDERAVLPVSKLRYNIAPNFRGFVTASWWKPHSWTHTHTHTHTGTWGASPVGFDTVASRRRRVRRTRERGSAAWRGIQSRRIVQVRDAASLRGRFPGNVVTCDPLRSRRQESSYPRTLAEEHWPVTHSASLSLISLSTCSPTVRSVEYLRVARYRDILRRYPRFCKSTRHSPTRIFVARGEIPHETWSLRWPTLRSDDGRTRVAG